MSAFIIWGAKIPLKYYAKLLLLPGFFLFTSLISILISIAPATHVLPAHMGSFTYMSWTIFYWESQYRYRTAAILYRTRQYKLLIFF
ncbi:hypothetical protein OL548_25740 [Lysinibacillus sp. MHQ-1]|nr:hypothetical protein OL548_25740 [Lysinibacillus sp. MHQ-1]